MVIKIVTKSEYLLYDNNNEYYLNCSEIEIEKKENFTLKIYPILKDKSKNKIPYATLIKIVDGKLDSECPYVLITNFQEFSIIEIQDFLINNAYSQNVINNFEFKYNDQKYIVEILQNCLNNLLIKSKNLDFKHSLNSIEDSSIYQINNFVIVFYTNGENNILIYNLEKKIIEFENTISQFEINYDSSTISVLQCLNDSLNHGYVYKFKLSGDFSIIEQYSTYLSEPENYSNLCDDVVFFDTIKAKNFKKARSFLSPELSEVLSDDVLYNYFKEFEEIKVFPNINKSYLVPFGKVKNCSILSLDKKDNLINNIKILYN